MQTFEQKSRVIIDATNLEPSNNKSLIHVLHVDDDPAILEISKLILMDMGNFEIDHACCVDEALKKLSTGQYDVVISDYEMPQKDGLQFLKELREKGNEIPFILFTGKGREEIIIKALNLGSDAYINKQGNPETVYGELSHSIVKTIERKNSKKLLAESESKYLRLFNTSEVGMFRTKLHNSEILECNEKLLQILGYTREEIQGTPATSYYANADQRQKLVKLHQAKGQLVDSEIKLVTKLGEVKTCLLSSKLISEQGVLEGSIVDITERKKAEEALRRSEEKHRIISGITADVTFSCNKKGEEAFFLDWISGACEKIFGYSAKEIKEKGCWKFAVQPKDLPIFEEKITNLKLGQKSMFELRITNKNGSTQWLKVNAIVDEDSENPGSLRLFGACTDITERKQKEFELQLERDKLETVTENIGAGLFLVDKDYKILWTNKMSKHHFGELESKQCYLAFRNLSDVCPDCGVREIFENGKEIDVREHCFKDTKGDPGWLELTVRPVKDETGKVVAALELAVPITERKEIEEKLRASSLYSRSLLEASLDPLVTISKEGKITDANKAVENVTGCTRKELIGSDFSDYFTEPEKARTGYQKVFTDGAVEDYPLTIKHKSGLVTDVLYNASIYRNSQGEIQGVFAAARDITERKKYEENLRVSIHKNELINEKLLVVGSLTRHDVGNKLMVVKSNLYLLKKQIGDNPKLAKYIEDINLAINQSDKMFEFSRFYEKIGIEEPAKIDVMQCFNQAAMLLPRLDTLEIVNDCPGLEVAADSLLKQLFYNFLDNSLKHGKKVTQIRLHYTEDDNGLKLLYEDNGIGVSEADKQKLFHEGFSTGKSTGLGLFLIKKMVEAYGWTINEEGEPGKGAKFIITIPGLSKKGKENYQIAMQ